MKRDLDDWLILFIKFVIGMMIFTGGALCYAIYWMMQA